MNDDCNFIWRQQSPLKSHHVGPLIHYNYTDSRVLGIFQPTYLEDIFRSTGISFKIKPDTRTKKSYQQYTLFKFYSVYFYGFIYKKKHQERNTDVIKEGYNIIPIYKILFKNSFNNKILSILGIYK